MEVRQPSEYPVESVPLQLQVIRASEFVRLDAHEHLDFEATTRALQMLAQACLKRGLDRALLDVRSTPVPTKPIFTPSQLATLVRVFWDAGCGPRHRLAVLYRIDPFGGARTFAFIGRIYRRQVRAFNDFEQAFCWLANQTEQRGEVPETARVIRKNQRQDEGNKAVHLRSARPRLRREHQPPIRAPGGK